MKFTFKSEHEFGTTVEINFDEEHLDEIEEMFKLFLRGSGFHIPDEDMYTKQESDNVSEECVPETDTSNELDAIEKAYFAGKKAGIIESDQIKRLWKGLTIDEIRLFASWLDFKTDDEVFNAVEATLKERNNG